ncbi:MAG: hypothetical protein EOP83_05705 [Verrucomicrobiaceae bacterium]|nr:MAG: hypothetical protein EOP83_05705 [Verrucomicrobiaceae bacterium]
MSIHKKDIESLLEAYVAVHSKGNMKASGELIPHLLRSIVKLVESRSGGADETCGTEACQNDPCCGENSSILLPAEDKAFAEATAAKHLREHGNATIETDKGSLSVSVEPGLSEKAGVDVEQEVAKALVNEVEIEGAKEITAVTSTIEATSEIDSDDIAALTAVEEEIDEKTASVTPPSKKTRK